MSTLPHSLDYGDVTSSAHQSSVLKIPYVDIVGCTKRFLFHSEVIMFEEDYVNAKKSQNEET